VRHHHGGRLRQLADHDVVHGVSHSRASGVQEHVSRERFERRLLHAAAVLVDCTQNRLYPFPVQRTARRRLVPVFSFDLSVRDARRTLYTFRDFRLEQQEFIVDRSSARLNVGSQRNVKRLRVLVEKVAVVRKGDISRLRK
jgi:hypothetical protein